MKEDTRPLQNITEYVPLIKPKAQKTIDVIMNVRGIFLKKEIEIIIQITAKLNNNSPVCEISKRSPSNQKIWHNRHDSHTQAR
jgi:hypothetical protein